MRHLFSDAASVSALSIVARAAGALKTVVAAYYFRPGPAMDAYLLAFLAPSFLGDVLAGAIGLALVPALHDDPEGYPEALHRAFRLLGWLALLAAAVAVVVPATFAPGWRVTSLMVLALLPIVPVMGVTAVWRAVLHTRFHFRAAAAAPLMTPLMVIACLPLAPRLGAMALAIGTTTGMLVEAALLAAALTHHGISPFPRWPGTANPALSRAIPQYAALAAANVMMRGSAAVDQAAAALLGAGGLSLLNYGTRLSTVLLAIGPGAIGTTAMPRFSRIAASGERARLSRDLMVSLGVACSLATIVVAVLALGSEQLTKLVFLRGAFTAGDVHQVSQIQIFSLLQLPFGVALAILSGVIASLKANHSLLPLWAVALALHAGLDFYLFKPLGVRGIALSSTVVQGFLVAALGWIAFRTMRKSD